MDIGLNMHKANSLLAPVKIRCYLPQFKMAASKGYCPFFNH
jgi:hypothetical protein